MYNFIDTLLEREKEIQSALRIAQTAIDTWEGTPPIYPNRESWLIAFGELLKKYFVSCGYNIAGNVRISCGFPRAKRKAIGQCWSTLSSKDKSTEIFISPEIDDPIYAGSILVHELVHAAVGVEYGHKAPFKKCAINVGLQGKMTATTASPKLIVILSLMFDDLGQYPHACLNAFTFKKQTTRLLKVICPLCVLLDKNGKQKTYSVRITQELIDLMGAPLCPVCQQEMKKEEI